MNLWAEINSINNRLEIADGRLTKISRVPPLEKLRAISKSILKDGVDYPSACYVQELANHLNIDHNIARSDFHGKASMMHVISFSRTLDTVIDRVTTIKQESK